jgi:hypothetical protein
MVVWFLQIVGLVGSLGSVPMVIYKVHAADEEKKRIKPSEVRLVTGTLGRKYR